MLDSDLGSLDLPGRDVVGDLFARFQRKLGLLLLEELQPEMRKTSLEPQPSPNF